MDGKRAGVGDGFYLVQPVLDFAGGHLLVVVDVQVLQALHQRLAWAGREEGAGSADGRGVALAAVVVVVVWVVAGCLEGAAAWCCFGGCGW